MCWSSEVKKLLLIVQDEEHVGNALFHSGGPSSSVNFGKYYHHSCDKCSLVSLCFWKACEWGYLGYSALWFCGWSSSQEWQFGMQKIQRAALTLYPQYPMYGLPMVQTYLYVNTATACMDHSQVCFICYRWCVFSNHHKIDHRWWYMVVKH